MEFLKVFDAASVTECYRRQESVVPQQAMALANSELTVRMARLLARDLAGAAGSSPEAFAAAAWEHMLARPATANELTESVAFLSVAPAGPGPRAAGSPDGRDDPEGKRPSADLAQRGAREPGAGADEPPRVRHGAVRRRREYGVRGGRRLPSEGQGR